MGQWWNYWRRRGHIPKHRIESYHSLDCSQCYKQRGIPLIEGTEAYIHGCKLQIFSSHALVTFPGKETNYRYEIPVVATRCNYGGVRHWFLCPAQTCNRRCKKLYLYPGKVFVCRECLKLAYTSQNRCQLDRIICKKWDLVDKLGGGSDFIMNKPKGMHHKTFNRIQKEIWRLHELAEQGIFERFGDPF